MPSVDEEHGQMNRIEQYLEFMIFMLRADGVVDEAEKTHMLSIMVDGLKMDPTLVERYRRALEETEFTEPTDQQLAAIVADLDPDSLAHLIRDAYGLAACDGEIHERELALLKRALSLAGIPESRFEHVDGWARHSLELARVGSLIFDRNYVEGD